MAIPDVVLSEPKVREPTRDKSPRYRVKRDFDEIDTVEGLRSRFVDRVEPPLVARLLIRNARAERPTSQFIAVAQAMRLATSIIPSVKMHRTTLLTARSI